MATYRWEVDPATLDFERIARGAIQSVTRDRTNPSVARARRFGSLGAVALGVLFPVWWQGAALLGVVAFVCLNPIAIRGRTVRGMRRSPMWERPFRLTLDPVSFSFTSPAVRLQARWSVFSGVDHDAGRNLVLLRQRSGEVYVLPVEDLLPTEDGADVVEIVRVVQAWIESAHAVVGGASPPPPPVGG